MAQVEATQKGVKQALPELELREIQKSAQSINQEGGSNKKIEALRSWNNYTIITLSDSKEIRIFDEEAKQVKDFKPPFSSKEVVVSWPQTKKIYRL